MSYDVDLTRRLIPWEGGLTVQTVHPEVSALSNLADIDGYAQAAARAVLAGLEAKARAEGVELVILTAKVIVTCSAHIAVDRKPKRRKKVEP